MKKKLLAELAVGLMAIGMMASNTNAAPITKPHTFANGTTTDATQVNANFDTVYTQVNTNSDNIAALQTKGLSTRIVTNGSARNTASPWGSEFITASCGNDEILTGGSCNASHISFSYATTNYGVVRHCLVAGNSIAGASVTDTGFDSASKYGPPITVYAICLSQTGGVIAPSSAMQVQSTTSRSALQTSSNEIGTPDEEAQQAILQIERQMEEYSLAREKGKP